MQAEHPDHIESQRSSRKSVLTWTIALTLAFLLLLGVRTFVANYYYIPSASMSPTLVGEKNGGGDYVLGMRIHDDPQPGDIMIFTAPESWKQESDQTLIKRVVAVPGDSVGCCGKQGEVLVNDKPLHETHLGEQAPFKPGVLDCDSETKSDRCFATRVLKEDEYWMMGDNRAHSADSSKFGPIHKSDFEAKATRIIYPLSRSSALDASR